MGPNRVFAMIQPMPVISLKWDCYLIRLLLLHLVFVSTIYHVRLLCCYSWCSIETDACNKLKTVYVRHSANFESSGKYS